MSLLLVQMKNEHNNQSGRWLVRGEEIDAVVNVCVGVVDLYLKTFALCLISFDISSGFETVSPV